MPLERYSIYNAAHGRISLDNGQQMVLSYAAAVDFFESGNLV